MQITAPKWLLSREHKNEETEKKAIKCLECCQDGTKHLASEIRSCKKDLTIVIKYFGFVTGFWLSLQKDGWLIG